LRSPYEKIYAVIARIPRGKVATYGQVAALAGLPGHARQVGTALGVLPESSTVPWQRVINARGEVSPRGGQGGLGIREGFQRHLLEEEGVPFDERGRIDLDRNGWDPLAAPPRRGRKRSPTS
jgi:methylated-DNA-protein-cysteine methyltransferase-like protein